MVSAPGLGPGGPPFESGYPDKAGSKVGFFLYYQGIAISKVNIFICIARCCVHLPYSIVITLIIDIY